MALIGAAYLSQGDSTRHTRADAAGCEAMQIFTRNRRQWLNVPLSFREIEEFYRTSKGSSVKKVVSHASYLINLGGNGPIRKKANRPLSANLKDAAS